MSTRPNTDLRVQTTDDIINPENNQQPILPRFGRFATLSVVTLAFAASLISIWYFYSHGWANICGDGISRLNGTRKLIDWDYPTLSTDISRSARRGCLYHIS